MSTLIAVTGTNGKTTCVELIAQLLLQQEHRTASIGTLGVKLYEQHMDLPIWQKTTSLTTPGKHDLQQILDELTTQNCNVVALEASSHGLAQGRLGSQPVKIAVFTNLTQDHLDYHHDMEQYFAAKTKLWSDFNWESAVINYDDAYGLRLLQSLNTKKPIYSFSLENNKANIYCRQVEFSVDGMRAIIITPWGTGKITTSLLGAHNLSNLLASITVAASMGISLTTILDAVTQLKAVRGRLERVLINLPDHKNVLPTVFVDFAHTPDALTKALTALRQHYTVQQIYCIFGCGGDRDRSKRPQMLAAVNALADGIVVTSDNSRNEAIEQIFADIFSYKATKPVIVEPDRGLAIAATIAKFGADYIILISGKGHETTQTIAGKVMEFDDHALAMQALKVKLVTNN